MNIDINAALGAPNTSGSGSNPLGFGLEYNGEAERANAGRKSDQIADALGASRVSAARENQRLLTDQEREIGLLKDDLTTSVMQDDWKRSAALREQIKNRELQQSIEAQRAKTSQDGAIKELQAKLSKSNAVRDLAGTSAEDLAGINTSPSRASAELNPDDLFAVQGVFQKYLGDKTAPRPSTVAEIQQKVTSGDPQGALRQAFDTLTFFNQKVIDAQKARAESALGQFSPSFGQAQDTNVSAALADVEAMRGVLKKVIPAGISISQGASGQLRPAVQDVAATGTTGSVPLSSAPVGADIKGSEAAAAGRAYTNVGSPNSEIVRLDPSAAAAPTAPTPALPAAAAAAPEIQGPPLPPGGRPFESATLSAGQAAYQAVQPAVSAVGDALSTPIKLGPTADEALAKGSPFNDKNPHPIDRALGAVVREILALKSDISQLATGQPSPAAAAPVEPAAGRPDPYTFAQQFRVANSGSTPDQARAAYAQQYGGSAPAQPASSHADPITQRAQQLIRQGVPRAQVRAALIEKGLDPAAYGVEPPGALDAQEIQRKYNQDAPAPRQESRLRVRRKSDGAIVFVAPGYFDPGQFELP